MLDSLYIAWQYLRYHKGKTFVLTASLALIIYLPAGLQVLVEQSARALRSRAIRTPLIVGARGSRQDLVLSTLYFEADRPASITMRDVDAVQATGFALAIPMHIRFATRGWPIVGTSLEYFTFRKIAIAQGRQLGRLGECIVGAKVARELDLQPGSSLVSSPENAFDLAGVYPLKMHVVGILAVTGTADDRAVFVDVKTAWVIEGLGHGHQDLSKPEASDLLLKKENGVLTANAAVPQFNEITPENIDSFHFHGDLAELPVSAIIAVPHDDKSATLLMGRYVAADDVTQVVKPLDVIEELLETVMKVKSFVIAGAVIVGVCAVMLLGLVFLLSIRLRRRELATMAKIGCSRFKIVSLVLTEIVLVFGLAVVVAAILTRASGQLGPQAIRWFLL